MTIVSTGPNNHRGLLFGKIVAAGLKALRPNLTGDISAAVIDSVAANVYWSVRECGMSYRDVGSVYNMSADECRGILTGKWRTTAAKPTTPKTRLPQIHLQPEAEPEAVAAE